MALVKTDGDFIAVIDDMPVHVTPGDIFDDDHPIVRKYASSFHPVRENVSGKFLTTWKPDVEQASAAPGEQRNARRR